MGLRRVSDVPHITVCICTFRRPRFLVRLLLQLEHQRTEGRFTFSVVVTDNDPGQSGQSIVQDFCGNSSLRVLYSTETRQNIALARNESLRHATGDFVAFIDDDEFPVSDWLLHMLSACEQYEAAGVLGPVRPHFENEPPTWLTKGRFWERPEYPTGRTVGWEESRTGNVLFRRDILPDDGPAFLEVFGTGGEDKDFFRRMSQRGHVFCWCNEGIVYETVPPDRWTRAYLLRRALLRGRNVLKNSRQRPELLAKSLIAAPLYSLALPITLLMGQHIFMQYSVRWCDHVGRLLAAIGLNPVDSR